VRNREWNSKSAEAETDGRLVFIAAKHNKSKSRVTSITKDPVSSQQPRLKDSKPTQHHRKPTPIPTTHKQQHEDYTALVELGNTRENKK
jgi:hypothetical protein